jgi:hypothetical protein
MPVQMKFGGRVFTLEPGKVYRVLNREERKSVPRPRTPSEEARYEELRLRASEPSLPPEERQQVEAAMRALDQIIVVQRGEIRMWVPTGKPSFEQPTDWDVVEVIP